MLCVVVTALLAICQMCQMAAAAATPVKESGGMIAPKVMIVSMVSVRDGSPVLPPHTCFLTSTRLSGWH